MIYSRIVRGSFFESPEIITLFTIEERYLIIGMICLADDFGKFWLESRSIKGQIAPYDDSITFETLDKLIEKLLEREFICRYIVNGMIYAHFPQWFEKGWVLKQQINHPREFNSPDCPDCKTEEITRRKRKKSRRSKEK